MTSDVHRLPAGASVWETDLHDMLAEHVVAERALLEEYVAAAESSGSEALKYIVDLLIEDERRHHRIWLDLAESLRADVTLVEQARVIPHLDFNRANADAVLEITERLLESERQDARQLKRVQKMLGAVEFTTLWGLLVELMQHDTDKHIAILRFASRQAKAAKK